MLAILSRLPEVPLSPAAPENQPVRGLAVVSLFFPVWYMAASWVVSIRLWRVRQSTAQPVLIESH